MNNEIKDLKLESIGYSDFFAGHYQQVNADGLEPARVIAEYKQMYIVRNRSHELSAKITGKMMYSAVSRLDYPAVGDWVLISAADEEQAVIHEIFPRKTVLKRKSVDSSDVQIIASNIDAAFIIQSPDRDYNLNRFERYITLSCAGGIKPVIILNKTDLISETELEIKLTDIKKRFKDIDIYASSIVAGKGIKELKEKIKTGFTYCFLGSSGVGKSSIINSMIGENLAKTASISASSDRGRHITTNRELFILESGGILIDNPGMRQIGILDSDAGIKDVFSEITELAQSCRYPDCSHLSEPGCAVLTAVDSGKLDKGKYDNYIRLVKEDEFNNMTKQEKRQKDKKFGKFIKNVKKQIKRYKN